MTLWFLVFGGVLFLIGSYAVMSGTAAMARFIGFSQLTIGLVVVAVASSSPELFVALRGAGETPDLVVGGIVGGAILTLTLMLGLGALIRPLAAPPKVVFRDGGALILSCAAVFLFARDGTLGRIEGGVLLVLFAAYIALAAYTDWRRASCHSVARNRAERLEKSKLGFSGGLFVAILGLVAVMLGAHFVLKSSAALAGEYGLPQHVVGLTVVALAVSLPELFVIMSGALRGPNTVAVGHVFGSNIFNLTLILGIAALVAPLKVSPDFLGLDTLVLFGVCALAPPLAAMRWRLSRPRGVFLMLVYGGYLAILAERLGLWSLPLGRLW